MKMQVFQRLVDFFPGTAHLTAHLLLSVYSLQVPKKSYKNPLQWRSVRWKGLYFPNPLSPAGGMDKNACHLPAWWALGAGFIEVGTVTPFPQTKLKGATLKRSYQQKTLWNHLGFPNAGVEAIQKNLKKWEKFRPTPIFANIGKNRQTPNHRAVEDYLKCITALFPYVDAFVINISSPNTPELSQLSEPPKLKSLLREIHKTLNHFEEKKPFFIKWSPDMSEPDFLRSLDIALECGAEGHIICNSTLQRPAGAFWPAHGGLSGAPLKAVSRQRLKLTQKHVGQERPKQLLISVGGILTVEDVLDRLKEGADLVQVYSGLIFNGPLFLKKVGKQAFD